MYFLNKNYELRRVHFIKKLKSCGKKSRSFLFWQEFRIQDENVSIEDFLRIQHGIEKGKVE